MKEGIGIILGGLAFIGVGVFLIYIYSTWKSLCLLGIVGSLFIVSGISIILFRKRRKGGGKSTRELLGDMDETTRGQLEQNM